MKKFGVIIYTHTDNFGDDIQTYAASKLLPRVDYFIDRENLDSFQSKEEELVYCIFNGWFLYNNLNWPPSKYLIPLPISMHFTYSLLNYPTSKDLYIERLKQYFSYYSRYGIGCRDSGTLDLLTKTCPNCYLSYCLTLTLQKFELKAPKEDYICLVDVSDEVKEFVYQNATCKVVEYTHDYRNKTFENISYEDRMKNVEERLKIYQNAKCVVTSRYHVALPCLALETPVALLPSNYEPSRYKDLAGVVHIYSEDDFLDNNVFDVNHPLSNPTHHLQIADTLRKTVQRFIEEEDSVKDVYKENLSSFEVKKYFQELEKLTQENYNLKRILWAKTDEIERHALHESDSSSDILENYRKLEQEYQSILNSSSWRITAFYRKIGGFIKKYLKKSKD